MQSLSKFQQTFIHKWKSWSIFSRAFWQKPNQLTFLFQPYEILSRGLAETTRTFQLQNCEIIYFCCFAAKFLVVCYGSHRKLIYMVEDTHHKSIPEDVLQDDDQSLSTTQLPSTLYFKSGSILLKTFLLLESFFESSSSHLPSIPYLNSRYIFFISLLWYLIIYNLVTSLVLLSYINFELQFKSSPEYISIIIL